MLPLIWWIKIYKKIFRAELTYSLRQLNLDHPLSQSVASTQFCMRIIEFITFSSSSPLSPFTNIFPLLLDTYIFSSVISSTHSSNHRQLVPIGLPFNDPRPLPDFLKIGFVVRHVSLIFSERYVENAPLLRSHFHLSVCPSVTRVNYEWQNRGLFA